MLNHEVDISFYFGQIRGRIRILRLLIQNFIAGILPSVDFVQADVGSKISSNVVLSIMKVILRKNEEGDSRGTKRIQVGPDDVFLD